VKILDSIVQASGIIVDEFGEDHVSVRRGAALVAGRARNAYRRSRNRFEGSCQLQAPHPSLANIGAKRNASALRNLR